MRAAHRAFALGLLLALSSLGSVAGSLPGLGDLEARLQLTQPQKTQFDAAAAATQRALLSVGVAALQMQVRISAELRKDAPDVDAILREQERAGAQMRPAFDEARTEWTRLYGMLSREQAAMARKEIDQRLSALEGALRELARTFRDQLKP